MESGKGADEELCLLPDEEREISEAEKERAMADQEENEEVDQENTEENENIGDAIEENGKPITLNHY